MSINIGTIITGIFLLILVGIAIFLIVKAKKEGKSLQCGMDCKDCIHKCKH